MSASTSLIDDFESSFQGCLSALTNPHSNHTHDSDETKTCVELTMQRFLDVARQLECAFVQKRLLLAAQKPELILSEDCSELKNEIARKDQILQKYYEKLQLWQNILNDPVTIGATQTNLQRQTSVGGATPSTPAQAPPSTMGPLSVTQIPSQGTHQQMRHQAPVVMNQQTHMIPPPIQSQMSSPMTPPQVGPGMGMNMPSGGGPTMMPMQTGQMSGMLPPPPPQAGQSPAPPMMNQMGQMQQFMSQQTHGGGLQGPLAYLERTTSNIGMPDPRR